MKRVCACGRTLTRLSLEQHLRQSSSCRQKLEILRRQSASNGGVQNPKIECECGFICAGAKLRDHLQGQLHHRLLRLMPQFPTCDGCGLPHREPYQVHILTPLHIKNEQRRGQLDKQTGLAQCDMFNEQAQMIQDYNETIRRLEVQMHQKALRLIQPKRVQAERRRLAQEERQAAMKAKRMNQINQMREQARTLDAERTRRRFRVVDVEGERIPQRVHAHNQNEDEENQWDLPEVLAASPNRLRFQQRQHQQMERQNVAVVHYQEVRAPLQQGLFELFKVGEMGQDCSICYRRPGPAVQLFCGHSFHQGCIRQWFTRNNVCPYCKQDIANIHRIRTSANEDLYQNGNYNQLRMNQVGVHSINEEYSYPVSSGQRELRQLIDDYGGNAIEQDI